MLYILISYQYNLLDNLSKPNYINIDLNLTNVTAEQVVEIINENLEKYNYIYFFIREYGNFELDFSLITKKDNSEITFYFQNGSHSITFTNVHPQKIKFAISGWGNYVTFRYIKHINQWYLKSDKGATKI